jgi:hypothetical protein
MLGEEAICAWIFGMFGTLAGFVQNPSTAKRASFSAASILASRARFLATCCAGSGSEPFGADVFNVFNDG